MLLLVGLGNPGDAYARNRHNIGFMALDAICESHGFPLWRRRFFGQAAEGRVGDRRTLALKPTTYMNESGRAVGEAARFFKIDPADIVVLHDEIDLVPGKLKMKRGGGHAGHNGLRGIHAHIGPDYRRVRLGIGHPGDKRRGQGLRLEGFHQERPSLAARPPGRDRGGGTALGGGGRCGLRQLGRADPLSAGTSSETGDGANRARGLSAIRSRGIMPTEVMPAAINGGWY